MVSNFWLGLPLSSPVEESWTHGFGFYVVLVFGCRLCPEDGKSADWWELCVKLLSVRSELFNSGALPPHLCWGPNAEELSVEEGRPCAVAPHGVTVRKNFIPWRITVQIQEVWMCLQMHQPFQLLQSQTHSLCHHPNHPIISIFFLWYFPSERHFLYRVSKQCLLWWMEA